MQKLKVTGGARLCGEVRASGAKNAALPILAASLLTADDLILDNVPQLSDIRTMGSLLQGLGNILPGRASHFRQTLGSQYHQRNNADDQKFCKT